MEDFRPVVTGIIGAIISFCLAYLMCKFFPDLYSENSLSKLRRKYGKKVRIANVLSGIGFVTGVSAYFLKLIPRNDWRGIGLAFGLMAILPFLYLLVFTNGQGIKEGINAFNAFSRLQRTPRLVMYTLFFIFAVLGLIVTLSLCIHGVQNGY